MVDQNPTPQKPICEPCQNVPRGWCEFSPFWKATVCSNNKQIWSESAAFCNPNLLPSLECALFDVYCWCYLVFNHWCHPHQTSMNLMWHLHVEGANISQPGSRKSQFPFVVGEPRQKVHLLPTSGILNKWIHNSSIVSREAIGFNSRYMSLKTRWSSPCSAAWIHRI